MRGGRRRASHLTRLAVVLVAVPAPAQAHSGHCTASETAGTTAVGLALALAIVGPWRKPAMSLSARLSRLALPLVVVLAATFTACGGKSATAARPATAARLQIVSPTPNQVTAADITLQLNLMGATVVPASKVSGKLVGTEGHIHVSLDGQLVSMAYGTSQDLHSLKPGTHSVQAEFVATDHQPFGNRVVAAVIFQVR
jgi:hypothetical protein